MLKCWEVFRCSLWSEGIRERPGRGEGKSDDHVKGIDKLFDSCKDIFQSNLKLIGDSFFRQVL